MEGELTYTVHLRDESGVVEPVETARIDYYDSGLWVHVDGGRDFYPYDRIDVIEEREAATRTSETDAGVAGSDETAGTGQEEQENEEQWEKDEQGDEQGDEQKEEKEKEQGEYVDLEGTIEKEETVEERPKE